MRKGGQYCSTRDLVVSIRGSPLAIASLDRAYCFARYLQQSASQDSASISRYLFRNLIQLQLQCGTNGNIVQGLV